MQFRKGIIFLTKLLLSCESVNFLLRDRNGETQLLYTIKYRRFKIFYEIIKNHQKLKNQDFVEMIFYCIALKLDDLLNYIITIWPINLLKLMNENDILTFVSLMTYLPLQYFVDQIDEVLLKSFSMRKYDFFYIIANRALYEKSLNIQKDFHMNELGNFKDFCKNFLGYSFFKYNRIFTLDSIYNG